MPDFLLSFLKTERRLIDGLIQPQFFPEEPIPIDGTTAHSLERLIPYISLLNGFQTLYYFDPSLYLISVKEWNILDFIKASDELKDWEQMLMMSY